jgi:uncharacterized protein DUF5677
VGSPSVPFDPADLPDIEAQLAGLAQALDAAKPSTPFGIIALGFGRRARSLWLGLLHAARGPSHASVQLILRALVEMTLLLPWLAKDPDVHPRLWGAEAARQSLKLFQGAPANAGPRLAAGLAAIATQERIAEFEETVAAARAAGLAAKVRGVGRRGSLVPTLADMVEVIGTPAAREAYGIAYNYLSGFTHSGARALPVHVTPEGVILDDGPPGDTRGDRTMAAVAYAMILENASEIAHIGIEDDVRALRTRMLAATPFEGS